MFVDLTSIVRLRGCPSEYDPNVWVNRNVVRSDSLSERVTVSSVCGGA